MAVNNRMVLLSSPTANSGTTELIASGGANNILVGELAINTNDGILFAGCDPDNASATVGGKVPQAADILAMTLSTAATTQAVGTGDGPTFASLTTGAQTINDAAVTINNGTTSSATEGGKLILAADDGQVMADNHRLGVVEFKGAEDTSGTLTTGARIQAIADAAWSGTENGASLEFYTTDADASQSVALTLDSNNLATFAGAVTANGGTVTIGTADINGGNIDGATIATSNVTVGSGKTLNVSGGTLTTSAAQKKAIVEGVGADTDIGAYELRAQTFESDVSTGTAPFTVASTTMVDNLNADLLDGVEASAFALLAGATFSGDIAMGTNSITGVADPSNAQDAATKAYVDATAQGLYIHEAVKGATTGSFTMASTATSTTLVLADGEGGFSASANTLTQDGVATYAQGDRILIKDGVNSNSAGVHNKWNGIYTVGALTGSSLTLTRATDFDAAADIKSGAFCFVQEGTTNADSGFVMTQDASITVGTTAITFSQFSGAGQITAGSGLTKSGNELDLTDIADDYILANTSGSTAAPTGVSAPMIGVITAANAGAARTVLGAGTGNGSMSDLSDDTSPQLGANLDTNSHNILIDDAHYIADESGNEQIVFQTTGSAVNYLEVTNAATGNGVTLGATGGDTNVDLLLTAAGSGVVKVDGNSLALGGNLTTAGAITHSGAHAVTLTTTGTTSITLPTSGTLVGTTATQTLTNKTLTGGTF